MPRIISLLAIWLLVASAAIAQESAATKQKDQEDKQQADAKTTQDDKTEKSEKSDGKKADKKEEPKRKFADKPVLRGILVVIKNVLGLLLVGAGLVMLITPGQGILSLLIGFSMLDIPGKQNVVNRILGNRRIINTINRIRTRAGRRPLELPPRRR